MRTSFLPRFPTTPAWDCSPDGGPKVVDLGGDHRLDDAGQYEEWFGEAHTQPESLTSGSTG